MSQTFSILAYGDPILRQQAMSLEQGTDVSNLVAAMFATMDKAGGIGLAAPQIGYAIRLFVVDLQLASRSKESKKVYINPKLYIEPQEAIEYAEEGCLSIPGVFINVPRKKRIIVDFFDIHWEQRQEELTNMPARIVQHEYDHLAGKLHIDYAGATKLRLLQRRLKDISHGKISTAYPMRFPYNKK
jgi:peptide deformylase